MRRPFIGLEIGVVEQTRCSSLESLKVSNSSTEGKRQKLAESRTGLSVELSFSKRHKGSETIETERGRSD
ncbi:hypothetical protein L596_004036 [Steinernema carpocapsae]|uniref:Uncharacterized protein n=1 Tax=Steinernema carpocapsae TaxID=34508 RepID=A0A4U8UVJ3_STECR|nr:hypothetical protein L596_004036 [Steinernema carpocapsae]